MPNRLADEKSPYLLQHAENPVDWMPWGDEAFARAQAEDKPILVSIGYSTCHWCHVMEHESFSVAAVAALMNKYLVCIKVDREERPDVDRVYMNAVTALTGQGGWPLNAFLTPDGRPFYGGTYFPPRPAYQRPSWTMLVEAIGKGWRDPAQRPRLLADAETVTTALKKLEEEAAPAGTLDAAAFGLSLDHFRRAHDLEQGGFAYAPKFPMPVNQHLLLRLSARYAAEGKPAEAAEAAQLALHTLRQMARGGIYDHLGGGFARYSTDERWHVPHFEKMLYDNAQLAMNYTEAWQLTGEAAFADTLHGTLAYVLRDLRAPSGAFYSAEDADSLPASALSGGPAVKKEGAFYVWSKAEILELLGPDNGELFCGSYGVEAEGNVQDDPHGEFPGLNVLYDRRGSLASLTGGAAELAPEHLAARLAAARLTLFEARAKRPRPQRDDKVLSSWNGLMIAALAKAGAALGEPAWLQAAREAAEFFLALMWEPERGLLWRRWAAGERAVEGHADDYAYLALGLFELHQADLDPRWLKACEALLAEARERFYDEADGLYYLAGRVGDPRLPVRIKDSHDNVEPAPASVFSELQLRLWALTGEAHYREDAERTLKALLPDLLRAPRALPRLAASLDLYLSEPIHVVVAGRREAADTQALLKTLRHGFRPRLVLLLADPDSREALPAYAQGFKLVDGRAAAYVCRGLACQAPVTDAVTLDEQLSRA